MKIANVVSCVPHYYAARIRALGLSGDRLVVLSAKGSGDFAEFVYQGVLHDIPIVGLKHTRPLEIYRETVDILDQHQPDVVVIAGWSTPECFAAIIWAKRNDKAIVVMSASQAIDAVRSAFREAIKARVLRACDAALGAGRRQKDYLVALGMPEERIFLGYDAVDNAYFERGAKAARLEAAHMRERHGLPSRYLLVSARFIPKKNLPRLIEAYATAIEMLDDVPDLIILGDGPERAVIDGAIAHAGVAGRVHLPGFRSYDLLPIYYGLAEAFVHVSMAEQWGLVINEAAAAGLPLLISRSCGAAPELVREDENGFLVDPMDTGDIARALRRLITLPADVRAGMGEASQRIVSQWGPERFAEGFMGACRTALAQPRRWLAPWDAVLIRSLLRRQIADVA
jgi:1,2-diacylglycerol 3-alpha-glucosyltransferase